MNFKKPNDSEKNNNNNEIPRININEINEDLLTEEQRRDAHDLLQQIRTLQERIDGLSQTSTDYPATLNELNNRFEELENSAYELFSYLHQIQQSQQNAVRENFTRNNPGTETNGQSNGFTVNFYPEFQENLSKYRKNIFKNRYSDDKDKGFVMIGKIIEIESGQDAKKNRTRQNT